LNDDEIDDADVVHIVPVENKKKKTRRKQTGIKPNPQGKRQGTKKASPEQN
jgi:hypothetical protein